MLHHGLVCRTKHLGCLYPCFSHSKSLKENLCHMLAVRASFRFGDRYQLYMEAHDSNFRIPVLLRRYQGAASSPLFGMGACFGKPAQPSAPGYHHTGGYPQHGGYQQQGYNQQPDTFVGSGGAPPPLFTHTSIEPSTHSPAHVPSHSYHPHTRTQQIQVCTLLLLDLTTWCCHPRCISLLQRQR